MSRESSPIRPHVRRSGRIARCFYVLLQWRDARGRWREMPAETLVLSRYGCLLACSPGIMPGDDVVLWWPQSRQGVHARVVCRAPGSSPDEVHVGLGFVDAEDFWGIEFPLDRAS
jgi:hypothetical protein